MVRLKVFFNVRNSRVLRFQFLMVRLKVQFTGNLLVRDTGISIPYGSIKSEMQIKILK